MGWASLVAQRLKHLPAMQETWVWSLGQEDPLEKEMATHSSVLAWRIPWMEEPGGLQSTGSQRVGHDWATSLHLIYGTRILNSLDPWQWVQGNTHIPLISRSIAGVNALMLRHMGSSRGSLSLSPSPFSFLSLFLFPTQLLKPHCLTSRFSGCIFPRLRVQHLFNHVRSCWREEKVFLPHP